jgi:phosphatidylglycerol---prolipoprotein diacylglyceryl transferase
MFPRILHIYGPLWIQSYGLMIALGFLIFLALTFHHPTRKKAIPGPLYINTVFWGFIAGVVGGRVLYVITEWKDFSDSCIEILYPWVGGFTVLGSIVGVLLVVPICLWINNIRVFTILDLVSMYAPLLQAISRMGCFLAGCCFGGEAPSWLPWAVTFTHLAGTAPLNIPLHPVQLYSVIVSLVIFSFLKLFYTQKNSKFGLITFAYLLLESASRFSIDFWRGDRGELFQFGNFIKLSQSQLLSLSFFMISLAGLVIIIIKNKYKNSLSY